MRDCLRARLPNGALFRWQFEKGGEVVQVEAKGRLTLDEAAIARAAVLDGAGIGFFIEQDVSEDISAGRLIRLLEDWTPPRPGFSLYYPGRRNRSAGFTAFLAMVREAAAQKDADQSPVGGPYQLLLKAALYSTCDINQILP